MKKELIEFAKKSWADVVGIAKVSDFGENSVITELMPNAKTVIGLGFRVLRGVFRGVEEGTTFYQYSTMGVECIEETIMPMTLLRVSNFLESKGYTALPQRRHQKIMADEHKTNPEIDYSAIYRGVDKELQIDFEEAAVKCGIGEKGLHGKILNDEFGPFIRYCFIITDAEIEPDVKKAMHLCDNCGKCVAACPGHAIAKDGKVDDWRCAVYYTGAAGTRNPFMPKDAFSSFPDRVKIIAGEADITEERAKEILDNIIFYPPIKHNYQPSICGRACDVECYVHLEEKGVLKKKFNTPFRKREKWEFDINDFK